jgi:hypothetical protein
VPHADLVVDVGVGQGDVGDDQMGDRQPLDHLGDDQRAYVAIAAHRLVADLLQHRLVHRSHSASKLTSDGKPFSVRPSRRAVERHDHQGDLVGHGETQGS